MLFLVRSRAHLFACTYDVALDVCNVAAWNSTRVRVTWPPRERTCVRSIRLLIPLTAHSLFLSLSRPAPRKQRARLAVATTLTVPTLRESTDDPFHSVTRTDSNVTTTLSTPRTISLLFAPFLFLSLSVAPTQTCLSRINAFFRLSLARVVHAKAACVAETFAQVSNLTYGERGTARGERSRRNVIRC